MEGAEQLDDDSLMDYESGIDTYKIDKGDSLGSFTIPEKAKEGGHPRNMNKENIKNSANPSVINSLRCFRMRKNISYQEFSSESDSEYITFKDDLITSNKRRKSEFSSIKRKQSLTSLNGINKSKRDIEVKNSGKLSLVMTEGINVGDNIEINKKPPTPLNKIKTDRRDRGSLSSEQISLMLSGVDDSIDNVQVNNREKLHSIENLSSIIDSSDSVKLIFYCNLCNFESSSNDDLEKHEETHKKKSACINGFKIQPNIPRSHMIVDNKSDLTNYKYSHREIKKETTIKADSNQILQCDICGYCSTEVLIYKSHQILYHSEKTELQCEYCDFKTSQCANLATHIRVHFRKDCPYCDYHCSLKSSLESHLLRYHQNQQPYRCEICNYACKSQKKFKKHLQFHANRQYQCEECKRFYSTKKMLKVHKRKHESINDVFECSKCHSRFICKHELKLHQKSHKKIIGSYVCSICNSSFKKKNHLINHSKVHMNMPKSFKCEICQSAFSQINHLKLHMRTHFPKFSKCEHCTFESANFIEFSKHVCVPVNKLYHVQRRPLNFQIDEENDAEVDSSVNKLEYEKNLFVHENNHKTCQIISNPASEKRKHGGSKIHINNNNKPKVLARQQNFHIFKTRRKMKDAMNNGGKFSGIKKCGKEKDLKLKSEAENKNSLYLPPRIIGTRKDTKSRNCIAIKKSRVIVKRQRSAMKEDFFKSSKSTKVLFGKKLTIKDFLVDPVRFINGSYVDCYYQNQQSPPAVSPLHHHQRHFSQNNQVLSCRYCRYKTNSQQLLKLHQDENHTWDPAVVSKLFS